MNEQSRSLKMQAWTPSERLQWWGAIIPKQQIRINDMLAEANRVSRWYAEVGYLVFKKDRFDEP